MLAFLSQCTDTDERNQIEGNASIGLLFSLDEKKIGNCFCVIYTENINILYLYGSTAFYRYVKMPSLLARQVSVECDSMPHHSALQNLLALCFCVARYDRYRHFCVAFMNLLLHCDCKFIHSLGLF